MTSKDSRRSNSSSPERVTAKVSSTRPQDSPLSVDQATAGEHAKCARAGILNRGGQKPERWRPRKLKEAAKRPDRDVRSEDGRMRASVDCGQQRRCCRGAGMKETETIMEILAAY
jgi:hypothetical protein